MSCIILFWMLVWKNFLKQKNNKLVFFLAITLPVISSLLLLYICSAKDRTLKDYKKNVEGKVLELNWISLIDKINARRQKIVSKQDNFTYNVFIPQISVAFAPNSNAALRNLMDDALGKLSIGKDKIVEFQNCNDLRTHASSEHYLASVCFRQVDESKRGLPSVLQFVIIMPSELRAYEKSWIGDCWKETDLFVDHDSSENTEMDEDSNTDYIKEGFVALQYHISVQYLLSATNLENFPNIVMRRFNENFNFLLSNGVDISAILLIQLGFMFPVTLLVKLIVEERELGQRYMLKANDVSVTLQTSAWFFNVLCNFLVTSTLITCLLKIAWNGTSSALDKCPWLVLFLFLCSYGLSVTSFVIFLASCFRNSKVAIVMVPIIWVLLSLPFLSDNDLISDVFYGIATVILCNVALSRGLKKMMYIEDYPLKVSTGKYLMYKIMDYDFGLIVPIACFYAQVLLFIIFTLALENHAFVWLAGVLKKKSKRSTGIPLAHNELSLAREQGISSEDHITNIPIEFRNVWKKFSKKFVVQDFNLSVYSGEIVALLGHNSSGKNTIVKMAYGLIKPSIGDIYLSGFNIVSHKRQAFKNSGISVSCEPLFSEYIVFDHLLFFCRLRGLKKTEAKEEVRSYLRYLKIEKIEKTQVKNLTIGQKRVLQVLCAFVGKTKIIILDKPFDNIDEAKARLLFNFVQEQKKNRSILFTTNSPKVASGLADRIAIISKGNLLSYATEKRFCHTLNDAYRLTLYGNENCDFQEVQIFLSNFIADIKMDSSLGDSAVYLIKYQNQNELIDLLENLTTYKEDLNVDTFQLQECSLDDILYNLLTREQSSLEFGDPVSQIPPIHKEPKERYKILILHFYQVLRQRMMTDIRKRFLPLLKLLLPTFVVIWTLCMPYFWDNGREPYSIEFPISDHDNGIFLMQKDLSDKDLLEASKEYVKIGATEVNPNIGLTKYIQNYKYENNLLTDVDFLGAVVFKDGNIEVLFNNKWPHTAPDSLALVMNSLAIGLLGSDAGIKVEFEPLLFSSVHSLQLNLSIDGIDLILASCLTFSFCFIWSIPILYMTLNQNGRYNYIELIAGMRMSIMILAFVVYDIVFVFCALLPVNLAVIFLQWDVLMDTDIFMFVAHVLAVVAICVLSSNILISICISDIHNAYLKVITFYSFGIAAYIAVNELHPLADPNTIFFLFLDFHPYYALLHNLMRIASISEMLWLCSDLQIYETSVYAEQCQRIPNCCDINAQRFFYFRYLCCVYLLTIVVWISIFICLKSHLVRQRPRQVKYFWDSDPDNQYDQNILHIAQPNELENTWIYEKSRVSTLERNYIESKVLHVKHVSVFFGLRPVLKHIDFMINRYQVLSVFGANGSGKTVLMKTILGVYNPSLGKIISSNKVPFKSENLEVCNLIGYSGQDVRFSQSLTILETFYLLLRIRMSNTKKLKEDANYLCKLFGLYSYRFQLLSTCSRGILKRLSVGIALMSDADLILLDDPFTHLDIISQRNILRLIHDVRSHGQSVIYTCTDTEFSASALRMVALSPPRIGAIGERQEIQQNYYTSYYVVETRIYMPELSSAIDLDSSSTEDKDQESGLKLEELFIFRQHEYSKVRNNNMDRWKYLKLCGLIEKIFPHAIIKTVSFPKVCFWLSSHMYSMAQIVKTLHLNKKNFYSYSISQPSVSSLFLYIRPPKTTKESFLY
ncbi:ATP-binding cassette sub-family A member 17 [Drosophila eugracilis]|uniref:ATP-binding cassette sub-family A member 17 n=1 Tax=Drosophila eugracilis TaxID=29029 RepID=UPI0007E5C182|nr:ATP-binding cassette sub-family A member 17 [Drosophila eugracilis]